MTDAIAELRALQSEATMLASVGALLEWDQETGMPAAASDGRADQIALVQGMLHDRLTDHRMAELLEEAGADTAHPEGQGVEKLDDRALVRETWRSYSRATAIPRDLVTALARQTSIAQNRWVEARRRRDFSMFAGPLAGVVELVRQKADALPVAGDRYSALLDEYEPWTTTQEVAGIFRDLESRLAELVRRIAASGRRAQPFVGSYPEETQRSICSGVLDALGFDRSRGRLDVSAHPFSTSIGPDDVRLTTRYDAHDLRTALYGTIHECGHGLYEQGFAEQLRGTCLAEGTSLGIHESQSRFWENMIGRSEAFCRWIFPRLSEAFPGILDHADRFYRWVNDVTPSLIRVEADEVTYNLHIILRFNLERQLIGGDIEVADLPEAWNEESNRLIGVVPEDDSQGVLQDIHWSMGAFGYFPTYALGNLYAAQFASSMEVELGNVETMIAAGRFSPILDWQREKIHRYGRVHSAAELCSRVTGEQLNPDRFLAYLQTKYGPLYDF